MGIGQDSPVVGAARSAFDELLPALARLDRRLRLAVTRVRVAFGNDAATDRFRGLYITDAEVDCLLAREPGAGALAVDEADDAAGAADRSGDDAFPIARSRLSRLASTFGLTTFDVDALTIAIAPDLDLRYERIYAFLQDDVTRRRPTLDLALTLLCDSAAERAARRSHFGVSAPLLQHRLIHIGDAKCSARSLLAESLEVDEDITNFLIGHDVLDRRLADVCRLDSPESAAIVGSVVLTEPRLDRLAEMVSAAYHADDALLLCFHGADGVGKRTTARALAATIGAPLLVVDAGRLYGRPDAEVLFTIALRSARLHRALTVIVDAAQLTPIMADTVVQHHGVLVSCVTSALSPALRASDTLVVAFDLPALDRRRALWRQVLARRGVRSTTALVDTLAARFRLTPRQIDGAVAQALVARRWAGDSDERCSEHAVVGGEPHVALEADALFAAARAQCGMELEALATRGSPRHRWADLVLPDDALQQLREICERVANRDTVVERWGFGERLARGGGVNALFSGPSGTGKTMAAEVMAGALGVDLFRVDLAGVVSKYIGETEKNLDRVFAAAEHANGIVFFDEADALFGKRSEVHDSHDRYANIEISYLLQKMEQFDGVAILATNLRNNLDDAFVRRLAFSVHFPFPDAAQRERIWRGIWPAGAPVDPALDLPLLAHRFALSGGHIKNIALASAFLAAERCGQVEMRDVIHATMREYQKLGRSLTPAELTPLLKQAV